MYQHLGATLDVEMYRYKFQYFNFNTSEKPIG